MGRIKLTQLWYENTVRLTRDISEYGTYHQEPADCRLLFPFYWFYGSTAEMDYRNSSTVGLAAALGMDISQAQAAFAAFPVVLAAIIAVIPNVILPKSKKKQFRKMHFIHKNTCQSIWIMINYHYPVIGKHNEWSETL